MKTYGGVEVQLQHFYLGTGGGKWSASRTDRFTPTEQLQVPIRQEDGRVGLGASMDAAEKWNISCSCREPNPGRLAHRYTGSIDENFKIFIRIS
jgi:hypothetical protein